METLTVVHGIEVLVALHEEFGEVVNGVGLLETSGTCLEIELLLLVHDRVDLVH